MLNPFGKLRTSLVQCSFRDDKIVFLQSNYIKKFILMTFNPHFEVIFTAIIWGSTEAFVKYLDLPPAIMSFFRLAIPNIIFFYFLSVKKIPLFRDNNKLILFASSLNVIRIFIGVQVSTRNTCLQTKV